MGKPVTANIVRLIRIDGLDCVDCHIHQSTDDCILASELSESLDLDGLCILPTKTVRSFDRAYGRVDFYNAAIGVTSLNDFATELLERLTCNLEADIRMLADLQVMVAVHLEIAEPDMFFAGRLRCDDGSRFSLGRISSRGLAVKDPLEFALSEVTKIEVATRYLVAIDRAATTLARPVLPS